MPVTRGGGLGHGVHPYLPSPQGCSFYARHIRHQVKTMREVSWKCGCWVLYFEDGAVGWACDDHGSGMVEVTKE